MIFFSVGTQLPFDRLGAEVERLAAQRPELRIVGQVGETAVVHTAVEAQPFMTSSEYEQAIEACALVVAHAGTGTIMAARRHGKPVVVVPRRADLREARSDHQFATCRALMEDPLVHVVLEPEQLQAVVLGILGGSLGPASAPEGQGGRLAGLRDGVQAAILERRPRRGTRSTYRVLACSSSGGHLSELLELLAPDGRLDVIFASTGAGDHEQCAPLRHFRLRDNSRWSPLQTLLGSVEALFLLWRLRPDVVLSTGALPGFLCVCAARAVGARAVWVDSFANAEEVSLAGRLARPLTAAFFVQWPGLADGRARYCGRVA